MLRIVARRTVFLIFVVLGVSLVTFLIAHLVPGDPARLMAGPQASPERLAELRESMGLDRPLPEQYLTYLWRLLHFDLGSSIVTGRPIAEDLLERIPATVELMGVALLLAVGIGIALGVLAAMFHDRPVDQAVRAVAVSSISLPSFWFGMILILLFYGWLELLPGSGRVSGLPPPHITGSYVLDSALVGDWAGARNALEHLILPATALAMTEIGTIARLVRSSMIRELSQEYVLMARAGGLAERTVLLSHALPNALLPLLTYLGLAIGTMLYGAVVTETVFAWPGLGRYVVDAVFNLDFPVVIGFAVIVSIGYVTINLIVDLVYLLMDPRIREVV